MIKPCVICGISVEVSIQSELITCQNENCIRTVENSIGLHYESGKQVYYGVDWGEAMPSQTHKVTFKDGEIESIEIMPLGE